MIITSWWCCWKSAGECASHAMMEEEQQRVERNWFRWFKAAAAAGRALAMSQKWWMDRHWRDAMSQNMINGETQTSQELQMFYHDMIQAAAGRALASGKASKMTDGVTLKEFWMRSYVMTRWRDLAMPRSTRKLNHWLMMIRHKKDSVWIQSFLHLKAWIQSSLEKISC